MDLKDQNKNRGETYLVFTKVQAISFNSIEIFMMERYRGQGVDTGRKAPQEINFNKEEERAS